LPKQQPLRLGNNCIPQGHRRPLRLLEEDHA
jgi:hypothetical protein